LSQLAVDFNITNAGDERMARTEYGFY